MKYKKDFKTQNRKLHLLLSIDLLNNFIFEENIAKVSTKGIKKEIINKYKIIPTIFNMVHAPSVIEEMLDSYNQAKSLIVNSNGNNFKKN